MCACLSGSMKFADRNRIGFVREKDKFIIRRDYREEISEEIEVSEFGKHSRPDICGGIRGNKHLNILARRYTAL